MLSGSYRELMKVNVKGKVVPVLKYEDVWGSGSTALCILNLGII